MSNFVARTQGACARWGFRRVAEVGLYKKGPGAFSVPEKRESPSVQRTWKLALHSI